MSGLLRDSANGHAEAPVAELKRALDFDPASAYRWANLGEALFHAGDVQQARYCFARAVEAGPRNPAILMRAANFWFSAGDLRKTLQYSAEILKDPQLASYYTPVFLTYTRTGISMEEILALGVPPRRAPAQAFLRFLMEGTETADAAAAWNAIVRQGFQDKRLTGEYVSFLLRNRQDTLAAEIWAQANRRDARDYRRTNWIYNGSFEFTPQPSPFDWHIEPTPDVEARRVSGRAQNGKWALELAFDGAANVNYHGPWQQAVLTKGRWHLEAFVRTEGITTDQGIGLRVFQPAGALDSKTEFLRGSLDWTKIEQTFEIAQESAVVQVEPIRDASLKFDSKIAGKVWVDSLRVYPENESAGSGSPRRTAAGL
ncbi:MAG TPA: tetratricopeptide repeat protein [Bryobacteraceae bacterium]